MRLPVSKLRDRAMSRWRTARHPRPRMARDVGVERAAPGLEPAIALAFEISSSARVLSTYLVLEARRVRRAEGAASSAVFEEARARVMAVVRVHDWLRYNGGPLYIEFGAYLEELCNDLSAAFCALDRPLLTWSASPCLLPSSEGVCLGLAATELVGNAYRYGFPDRRGGRVTVEFSAGSGASVLVVEDSGCTWRPSGSRRAAALRVVQALVEHLDGAVEVSASVLGGNRCTVTLPAPRLPPAAFGS